MSSMIQDITSQAPRNKHTKRKGRGESSGHGKTSGKGTKGAGARQGGPYWKRGHEGGQTSIFRRFPKRGFSNDNFERRFYIVNLEDLAGFPEGATVDAAALVEAGLVPDLKQPVKILGDGEISHKLIIVAGWFSKTAVQKITAAGGTVQNAKGEEFVFPKPKKKFVLRPKEKKAAAESAPAGDKPAPEKPVPEKPVVEKPAAEPQAAPAAEKSA